MKIPCKGASLLLGAGGVLVAVAQVTEAHIGAQDPEVFDATTLDQEQAGRLKIATGFLDQGDSNFTIFYDPALHVALAEFSQNPGDYQQQDPSRTITGAFALPDDNETALSFTAAAVGLGQLDIVANDGLKMSSCTIKHSGEVVYPAA